MYRPPAPPAALLTLGPRSGPQTGVAQNVGVFTTHSSKIWSLTNLCASLLKGAVRVSPALFTVCESIYNPRTVPVTPDEALEVCFRQVSRFRDHDDGSVSGKGSGTCGGSALRRGGARLLTPCRRRGR